LCFLSLLTRLLLLVAAVALSSATSQLVETNQMDDNSRAEKKIADAFEELLLVDLKPNEEVLQRSAVLRKGL
jgi:hypothetical protein